MKISIAGVTLAMFCAGVPVQNQSRTVEPVRPGIETFLTSVPERIRGKRVGLITNHAGIDRAGVSDIDLIAAHRDLELAALFAAEHGIRGVSAAGEKVADDRDPKTGLPIFSLYMAEDRGPTPEMLKDVDALVYDLPEVGGRTWTYVSTMALSMQAAARQKIPFVVLDRPNPIGGTIVEGPPLDPAFCSFVGLASIPMRHGLTMGELLRLINVEHGIGADLHVVPMTGWMRSMRWSDLDRPWVLPSPNVPRFEGVQLYPGQVLLEGTNLSEGRGTTTPFEWCGAPYIDPERLIAELMRHDLPGVVFRPIRFIPTFDKWRGESCGGVAMHVVDAESFRPWRTTVAILAACRKLWPDDFAWLDPPYEYETVKMPVDIIDGSSRLRETIESTGGDVDSASLDEWDREAWQARIKPHSIYDAVL
jgi:uncharacterized protein YbbC (DUF1343 family)